MSLEDIAEATELSLDIIKELEILKKSAAKESGTVEQPGKKPIDSTGTCGCIGIADVCAFAKNLSLFFLLVQIV